MSKNIFKTIALFFMVALLVPFVSAELNIDSWFSNGKTSMTINPGDDALYAVSTIADYDSSSINVVTHLYDDTYGTYKDLGQLAYDTHYPSDAQDIFFDVEDTVLPSDYKDLPGEYNIEIKVTQRRNGLTTIKTDELQLTVSGQRPPTVDFSWTPQNPTTDDIVQFLGDASVHPTYEMGYIAKYEWDFNNDGVTDKTGLGLPHTFPASGDYPVTLTVTDSNGAKASKTKTVTVSEGEPDNVAPEAKFSFSPSNPKTNQEITFTSTSSDSDGTISKEEWDFNNDGVTDKTGRVVKHTFVNSGSKPVTLKVTDNDNAHDSETKTVSVSMPNLEIYSIGCNANVVKGEIQHCSVELTEEIENVEITFRYASPSSVKDEFLGTCDTNFKGKCHINPVINKDAGYYDVYATARKTGYNPDNSKELETTFRVWEKQYQIENLRTFEDPFVTEQYTFYRNNPVYASFDVRDLFTGELVPMNSDLVEEVILRVNNAQPLPFEPIGTFTLSEVSEDEINQYLQASSVSFKGYSSSSANSAKQVSNLAGDHRYKLELIPITDDYLGQGKVFAFTFNFEDNTAGQGDVNVNILNNDLTFDPQTYYLTDNGETITIDFKNDLSDVETQPKDVKITFGSTNLNINHQGNNVFKVYVPNDFQGFDIVFFTADDTDGSIVEVPIKFEVEEEELFPPNADFDWSPENPIVGQTVTFTSKSTDSDGTIEKYEWSINGDTVTTRMSRQSVFTEAGYYSVSLKVTDNDGLTDTVIKNVYVGEPENVGPTANFDWTPKNPIAGSDVTLFSTSTDSDGTIESYHWTINGNYVNSYDEFEYIFANAGTYTVKLTVADDDGASDSVTKTIFVSEKANVAPTAKFDWTPKNPLEGQNVHLESESFDSDGYINAYEWKIEGTVVSYDAEFNYVFPNKGTYQVQLTVWDDDGARSTVINDIFVGEKANLDPVADFFWTPQEPRVNDVVIFESDSYDPDGYIVEYRWSVNSDYKGDDDILNFVFQEEGYHYVTLKVKDNKGATDEITKTVYVKEALNVPPTADFVWEPAYPKAGETVQFKTKSKDSDGSIADMKWESPGEFLIHDDNFIIVQFPHAFEEPGTYYVTHTVTDDDGAVSTITKAVHVQEKDNIAPIADFEWKPTNPQAGEEVEFLEKASDKDGTIVSYVWEIEGTVVSYEPDFKYTFNKEGNYKVKLTVTDNDGASNYAVKYVNVDKVPNVAPVADFEWRPIYPIAGDDVVFDAHLSYDPDGQITAYYWEIDGRHVSTYDEFEYIFANAGTYKVKLTVTDNDGAKDSVTKTVYITEPANEKPISKFHFEPTNPIVGDLVKFISDSYDPDGQIVKYEWRIEDIVVSTNEMYSQTFAYAGCFDVSLIVTDDDGAMATSHKTLCVGEKPNVAPVAQFDWRPENPIAGDDVVFDAHLSYDSDGTIESYYWKIDGKFVSSYDEFEYIFANAGTYSIMLTVTDDDGATDSITKVIYVKEKANVPPVADFHWEPTQIIEDQAVWFFSDSYDVDGEIVYYEWIVNGYKFTSSKDIHMIFEEPGTYPVTHKVRDNKGAEAQVTKTVIVEEDPNKNAPVAILKMPGSTTIGKEVIIDGSASYDPDGLPLKAYIWTIKKGSNVIDSFTTTNPKLNYVFNTRYTHTVELTVVDAEDLTGTTSARIDVGKAKYESDGYGKDDGVFIDYFDVYGTDLDTIDMDEAYTISARVTNARDDKVENMHLTFQIPELGYKISSSRFDIKSGDTKQVVIQDYLPFLPNEVEPGEYYALISVAGDGIIRTKHYPLMIR